MATLTGYGGIAEIGGNAFLLDDGRSRLFLDFGKRFGNDVLVEQDGLRAGWMDYFDEYLKPRSFCYARDLLALGMVPEMPELYRTDLGGAPGPAGVDGVLLSHAHTDHCGLIGLLKPEVEVVSSAESRATMASLQETGGAAPENEFVRYRPKGHGLNRGGGVSASPQRADGDRTFRHEDRLEVGTWQVESFAVDHSIHGARGFVVSGDTTLAYTGDLRMHGRDRDATRRFVERAAGADVLVTEGTRVHRSEDREQAVPETDEEVAVEGQIEALVDRYGDGFVAISHPPRDLDRFISIWNVARRTGRRFAISTKQAHLLDALRAAGRDDLPDPRRDPHLAIHLRAKRRGLLGQEPGQVRLVLEGMAHEERQLDLGDWRGLLAKDYDGWERPYLESPNLVTSRQLAKEASGHLFSISYWTITELFDIFPDAPRVRPGGLYIHSMTQPFNDEMEISDRKLRRWLDAFGLRREDTHVSGHLGEQDLEWMIDELSPRRLVPVHSLAPDVTAERYEARTGMKALMPHYGRSLELS